MSIELIGWWLMAAIAVVSAIGMLSARNPVHSVLWLVVNFTSLAVIYLIHSAPVLFAIQLIVYAGAIMVLFLFVVMFFMSPQARQWLRPALKGQLVLGGILVVAFLLLIIWGVGASGMGIVFNTPLIEGASLATDLTAGAGMGDPRPLGWWLFSNHVLPFELTSLLLLIAMIGALMVARDLKSEGRAIVPETAPVVSDEDDEQEVLA